MEDAATGETPLGLAAGRGMAAMVRMLLQARADINKAAEGAEAPLCKACAGGHADVVRLLLEAGADRTVGSPLCSACDEGHTEIVQLLLTALLTRMLATPMAARHSGLRAGLTFRMLYACYSRPRQIPTPLYAQIHTAVMSP